MCVLYLNLSNKLDLNQETWFYYRMFKAIFCILFPKTHLKNFLSGFLTLSSPPEREDIVVFKMKSFKERKTKIIRAPTLGQMPGVNFTNII